MSVLSIKPLVQPRDDGLQLSYQLPHRIYCAKAYPVLSPNGSSIIIYGSENGLKVIWRGGSEPVPTERRMKDKLDGTGNDDAIMIVDSDEEVTPELSKDEYSKVQLENRTSGIDISHPFDDIIRYVDIPLGGKVLDLAVPHCVPDRTRSSFGISPPVLSQMIVISAICADFSTRVVALPLAPPQGMDTAASAQGIQTLSISGSVSHQEIPRGVTMTFTFRRDEEGQSTNRAQVQGAPAKDESSGSQAEGRWDLLVATHSAEASGTLLVYRIPIIQQSSQIETSYFLLKSHIHPIQKHYLPAPARSISFSPSPYPSARHSNLLVSFSSGYVKVYSCLAPKPSKVSRSQQGSSGDTDTAEPQGRWLITLYPSFEQSSTEVACRKTVVDAKWVLGGRAVIVLLADGEWGVWDIEGAGPGSEGPLHHQSSVHGVTGGSLTRFAVSGRVVGMPQAKSSQTADSIMPERARFVPLTPSTKRIREDTLFKGSHSFSQPSVCGEISVIQTNSLRDAAPEESILLRHGNQSVIIPSLLSLWRNAVKVTGTFDALNRCRMSSLGNLVIPGETMNGIDHLPVAPRRKREIGYREFDILITTEHRLIILAPRLSEPKQEQPDSIMAQQITKGPSGETDQLMLMKGELDVDGVDRVLSEMASPYRPRNTVRDPSRRGRIFS
ncbi:hypothetical protein VTN00DRAFT_7297 [Thermoascus crustaceus]|uniref:uncharacterized protein n=1 Tax=Thermoascus crustaceus TaxID=5088 RepID=UPI00374344ED